METHADSPFQSSLSLGVALLSRRIFPTCCTFIERHPKSDSNIVALVDVLESASLQLCPTKTHLDHYSVLQVKYAANCDFVQQQFKQLVRLLDPKRISSLLLMKLS
ncbi:hypothetical protein P8452_22944 [Trifolium repens]|nr:hypothetical protein P8452_22944 [Trifolium repens]